MFLPDDIVVRPLFFTIAEYHPNPLHRDIDDLGLQDNNHRYCKPTGNVSWLPLRIRPEPGEWSYHVLVFDVTNAQLFWLAHQSVLNDPTPEQALFAVLAAYDLCNGGIETTNKGSKQGLGITKRNKRLFAAQEMLSFAGSVGLQLDHLDTHYSDRR